MKILFLAQRVPYPPNKGDKLRSYHLIRGLAANHEISLACLADNTEDIEHAGVLKKWCQSVDVIYLRKNVSRLRAVRALFSSKPLTLGYFHSPLLLQLVRQKLQQERFDAIFIYCSSMAPYVEDVATISRVIDFVDVDSEKWKQYSRFARFPLSWVYALESRRLRHYEKLVAASFDHCFLVSEKEVEDFRKRVFPCKAMTAICNGVDCRAFSPTEEQYDPQALVFTGAMDYFANVEAVVHFVREILPLVVARKPGVKLYVVGSNPAHELITLARENPRVIVTGYVERVQPYMAKAAVFVAPMRIARGVQNKILEAMAMGLPVVTTSLGYEGLNAVPEKDLFVEDNERSFALRILSLMEDKALRLAMSRQARAYVNDSCSWQASSEKLENILVDVVRINHGGAVAVK